MRSLTLSQTQAHTHSGELQINHRSLSNNKKYRIAVRNGSVPQDDNFLRKIDLPTSTYYKSRADQPLKIIQTEAKRRTQ